MKYYTADEMKQIIESDRANSGMTQKQYAEWLGVRPNHLNAVLKGFQYITNRMIAKLGYERVYMYRKKENQ